MPAALIDTNVLVYSCDPRFPGKQRRALDMLDRLQVSGQGRISVQCLGEFFRATTRGVHPLLTVAQACARQAELIRAWRILDLTPFVVLEAARGVRDHRLSYWDAQIWATARLNQLGLILSEDFQSGLTLEGVQFADPFRADFDLDTWIDSSP